MQADAAIDVSQFDQCAVVVGHAFEGVRQVDYGFVLAVGGSHYLSAATVHEKRIEIEITGLFGDAHGELGVVDGEGGKRALREHGGTILPRFFLARGYADGLRDFVCLLSDGTAHVMSPFAL